MRFNSSTQQIAEFKISNIEAEEFMNERNDNIKRLEKAIHETFRGKNVNPYIYNILSENQQPPSENFYPLPSSIKYG